MYKISIYLRDNPTPINFCYESKEYAENRYKELREIFCKGVVTTFFDKSYIFEVKMIEVVGILFTDLSSALEVGEKLKFMETMAMRSLQDKLAREELQSRGKNVIIPDQVGQGSIR